MLIAIDAPAISIEFSVKDALVVFGQFPIMLAAHVLLLRFDPVSGFVRARLLPDAHLVFSLAMLDSP